VFAALTTIGVSAEVTFDTAPYTYNGKSGVTITGFNGLKVGETVTIPAEIDGKPVLALGLEGALECISGAENIGKLDLTKADNLKVINQYAFYYCKYLCGNEDTIKSATVEKVEKCAFDGCYSIEGIKLDNCITVGDYAFQAWYGTSEGYNPYNGELYKTTGYRSQLKKVDLPNCKTMGWGAFIQCRFLKRLICQSWSSFIGIRFFSVAALKL
jgi:hypothetical protein